MKVIVLGNIDKTDFLYTTNELLCALEKYKVEILVGEIEYNICSPTNNIYQIQFQYIRLIKMLMLIWHLVWVGMVHS